MTGVDTFVWYAWQDDEMPALEKAMNVLRKRLLPRWKIRVRRSFTEWLNGELEQCGVEIGVAMCCVVKWCPSEQSYTWSRGGRDEHKAWVLARRNHHASDIDAAADGIGRAAEASWWEWEDGSRPFHWRWPSFYRDIVRDGLQIYVRPGENKLEPQDDTRDPKMKAAMLI